MKKIINVLAIVFFLTPIFASAAVVYNYGCADFVAHSATCALDVVTFSGSGGYVFDQNGPVFNLSPSGGETWYVSFSASGSGTGYVQCGGSNNDGAPVPWTGSQSDLSFSCGSPNTSGGLVIGDDSSFVGTVSSICVTDTPGACVTPPAPSTGIDAAIANATSSFQNTYGFDMDGIAAWMWDNLGQPIAGSGLGTLMVLKWQILGLISISIIVFFAFAYFRFFKH